jgi:hypothetical protein
MGKRGPATVAKQSLEAGAVAGADGGVGMDREHAELGLDQSGAPLARCIRARVAAVLAVARTRRGRRGAGGLGQLVRHGRLVVELGRPEDQASALEARGGGVRDHHPLRFSRPVRLA